MDDHHLPDELIIEILARLPSKSLLRFLLVSKSWCSLISSKKLQLKHLKTFNLQNPRNVVRHFDVLGKKEIYSVHFNDEALTMDLATPVEFPVGFCDCRIEQLFGFSRKCIRFFDKIIGYVNGVFCFLHDYCNSGRDKIFLWNPSIRKKFTITPATYHSPAVFSYGFGYDEMSHDYKVVILGSRDTRLPPYVQVYSVKNPTARVVRFPDDLSYSTVCVESYSQVFINGCTHWIIYDDLFRPSKCSILAFDMSTELFAKIELPERFAKGFHDLKVSTVEECLAVIYAMRPEVRATGPSRYLVYAMREYKNTTSWMVMYDVRSGDDMGPVLRWRNDWGMTMGCKFQDLIKYDYKSGLFDASYFYMMECSFAELITYDFKMDFLDTLFMKSTLEESFYVDKYQESLALLSEGHTDSDGAIHFSGRRTEEATSNFSDRPIGSG